MYRRGVAANIGFLPVTSAGAAIGDVAITVYRVIDGGARAAATGTATYEADGHYNFAASAADMNGSHISFAFYAVGAVPVEKTVVTTAANPDDAAALGLTDLAGGSVIATAVGSLVVLTIDPHARALDSADAEITDLTLSQVLGTIAVNTLGDRTGLGTAEIVAAMTGVTGYSLTANRISSTEIQMTIVVPAGA